MKHPLLRWLTCISFLICLAFSARAEANFIYIIGNDNRFLEPCTANASYFESNKLYETSPGSDIYEGVVPFTGLGVFRFVYELPEKQGDGDYSTWKRNVIAPFVDLYPMERLGKSGVYSTSVMKVVELCDPYTEPGTWRLFDRGSNYYEDYKVIVNLRLNKIFVVPTENVVVVHDNMAVPTLDNIADYTSVANYKEYLPAGSIGFNMYDIAGSQWWNNASDTPLTTGYNELNIDKQPVRADGYKLADWKGGVMTMNNAYGVRLQENSGTAVAEDVMYLHRSTDSFTPWNGASAEVISNFEKLTPDGNGNYVGNIEVVANEKINFISALGGTQEANSVICPPSDRNMNFNEASGMYFSSAVVANQTAGAYWIVPGEKNFNIYKVTVTPGDKPVVKFEGEKIPNEIYLVGSPQGWDITSDSMPLKKTVNGGYYGSYNIAAGDVLFRFYTSLGSWDNNSLGSQYDDNPIDLTDIVSESTYEMVRGKGSFLFSSWSGGMMYMYVQPSELCVTFSKEPIAAAGEFAPEITDPKGIQGLYDADGHEYNKNKDGLYHLGISLTGDETREIKLYTYNLPISDDESEAEGSYALTLPNGHQWKFDEFGVAETSFDVQECVTTNVPNHVVVKNEDGIEHASYTLAIDMESKKMYLERMDDVIYLLGAFADGKVPTYATRQEFKQYIIKNRADFIDVPQNKLDFIFVPSIDYAVTYFNEADFDPIPLTFENGIANIHANRTVFRVSADQWTGGRLFVSTAVVMDARNIDKIHALVGSNDKWKISTLKETTPGGRIYEGDVSFDNVQNPTLMFSLDGFDENNNCNVPFASLSHYNFMSQNYAKMRTLVAKNNVMAGMLRFYGFSFELPSVKGSGVLKVKVDLNTMEMTAQLPEENKASVYESVADNSSLDEVVASQSSTVDNAVTLDAQVNANEGEAAEFNFASPEGEVIVPASGQATAITFGADGVWEGDFVKVGTPLRSRSAARKAAAANDAKWSLSLPEGVTASNVAMLINEDTKKIKVFSSAHKSDGFFLVINAEDGYTFEIEPNIEHIDALPQLTKVSDGIYKGVVTVPETGLRMRVANSLFSNNTGISGLSGFGSDELYTAFELADGNDEKSQAAWNMSYANQWTVRAPAGKATVTYDEKASKLIVKSDAGLGCEDLTADNGTSFRLVVGEGCVTVMSDGNTDLDFVNAAGAVTKHVSVTAGTTTINLVPGFYIVAGQKIFVK